MNITEIDIEEFACYLTGLDYDKINADTQIIEEKLHDEFNIDLETFTKLVNKMIPLIDVGSSPITKKKYKGFSNQKGIWFCKIEI